jgi:hypothetical protein
MICKVNPADVVAVPSDYNNAKMRVCKYEVINEVDVKDEEIPENVVRDSEAYDSSLRGFRGINEALMAVRQDSFREILERLKLTKTDETKAMQLFDELFSKINNRTKNWRNKLLDQFVPRHKVQNDIDYSEDMADHEPECNEVYEDEVYENIDDLVYAINNFNLHGLRYRFSENSIISEKLSEITNSTYMWRRILLDVVNGIKDSETKGTFGEILEDYLKSFEVSKWILLRDWLNDYTSITEDFVSTCYNLNDMDSLIKRIKKARKNKEFKKKKLLAFIS